MAQRRWPKVLMGLFVAAGLLVWALAGSSRRLRSTLVCGAALQKLVTTAKIYASDLPIGPNATSQDRIAALIQAGHLHPDQTICPASKTPYVLLPLPDLAAKVNPRRVIAYETRSNHGQLGGNIVYADGHAESLGEPNYTTQVANSTRSNHGQLGGNVVYADGHAEFLGEPKYTTQVANSRQKADLSAPKFTMDSITIGPFLDQLSHFEPERSVDHIGLERRRANTLFNALYFRDPTPGPLWPIGDRAFHRMRSTMGGRDIRRRAPGDATPH